VHGLVSSKHESEMDMVHDAMSRVDFNAGNKDDNTSDLSGDDEDCVIT